MLDPILVEEALHVLFQTAYSFARQEEGQFSVSWQESYLLKLLSKDNLKMGDIATVLKIKPFQATRMIDGLVGKGLVERRTLPADKRIKDVVVLPAGKQLLEDVQRFHYEVISLAAQSIGEDRAMHLLQSIAPIAQLFQSDDDSK